MGKTNEQIAIHTARNSIILNTGLAAFKLFSGIYAQSAAMVSDGVESIADLCTTVIVIVGIKLSNKKPDSKHHYGHERFECVAALLLAATILTVGAGIGYSGLQRILAGNYSDIPVPGLLALVAAAVTIVSKEALFWYVRTAAKKIDSSALMADAWHSRTDAFSSIGTFLAILGARLGFPILDSVSALIICLFIGKTAVTIALDAIGKMTDKACDDATAEEMRSVILAQASVDGIDQMRTRLFGSRIYVDVEICVNSSATLGEAHMTAQHVHDAIEKQFSKVKHCMVHVNPTEEI